MRILTIVPVSGICNGPGKGLGSGPNRDYSSGFKHQQRSLQGSWQRSQLGLQFRCNGLDKGLGNGANLDYTSGLQTFATGLTRGLASVRIVTTVPVYEHLQRA